MTDHLKKARDEFDANRSGYEYEEDENYLFASKAYLRSAIEEREDQGAEYAFDSLVASIQLMHIYLEKQEREKAGHCLASVDGRNYRTATETRGTFAKLAEYECRRADNAAARAAGAKEERERIVRWIRGVDVNPQDQWPMNGIADDIKAGAASNG